MLFSRYYRDHSSEDDDVGLVFTRDKYGKLKSPNGYDLTANIDNKSYLKDIEPTAASCSVKDQQGKFSPCSLYHTSLDFVAKNVTMVESLYGFPDIVGKDLFDRVHINGAFAHKWSQTFPLFCEAYGSLVLDKLSLNGEYLAVNEIDYLKCFDFLSELDLSHCQLGSNHELLHQLAHMSSLTRLSLKDNCLDDNDVRSLTLPVRVKKEGPCNLSLLDLSANPRLSDMSMRYLMGFKSLTGVNLSGTSVTGYGIAKLTRETHMVLNLKFEGFNEDQQTVTDGWATPVITEWITNLKTVKKDYKQDTTVRKVQSFYAKKTKARILQENNSKPHKKKESSVIIILSSDKNKDKNSQSTTALTGLKQSERTNGMGQNNERDRYKHKRKKDNSVTEKEGFLDLDEDLMQSYLSSSVLTCDNKKRRLSLADLVRR